MLTPPKKTMEQMLRAWQKQLVQVVTEPWLFKRLIEAWGRLLHRFRYFYQRLLVLPRSQKWYLKKKFATTLAGVALLLALGQTLPARAATIIVDGQVCTLADAITAANTDLAAGGCLAGSGADVLDLQADVLIPTTLPIVWSEMTLNGNGHTIDAQGANQILHIEVGGNLTIHAATLTGGYHSVAIGGGGLYNIGGTVTLNDCLVTGNTAAYNGGGLANIAGTMTLNNTTVYQNSAGEKGGGIYNLATLTLNESTLKGNLANDGGAVFNEGTVVLHQTVLSGNFAGQDGGGIANMGNLSMDGSVLKNNYAGYSGGGIHNAGEMYLTRSTVTKNEGYTSAGGINNLGQLAMKWTTISHNTAVYGGGIQNRGELTIDNSTLHHNSSGRDGGGILNSGLCTLNNSTISANHSGWPGGGIVAGGLVTLFNSTITGNQADWGGAGIHGDNVILNRSIVSGNGNVLYEQYEIVGLVTANNYNVIGFGGSARSLGFVPGPKDLVPAGPLETILSLTLADNGGLTLTHALVPGSPAIDMAPNDACAQFPILGVDQRGAHYPRNVNGLAPRTRNDCDAGAFEYQLPLAPTPTPKPTKTPTPPTPQPTRTPSPTQN